jgi:hypothetical protein
MQKQLNRVDVHLRRHAQHIVGADESALVALLVVGGSADVESVDDFADPYSAAGQRGEHCQEIQRSALGPEHAASVERDELAFASAAANTCFSEYSRPLAKICLARFWGVALLMVGELAYVQK